MEDLISIIVPVYNVEKYVERCLKKIISQTYVNLEIILINDGSSDEGFEICKKYALQDYRIRVIDKENTGVSDTRNIGLENMTGKYVVFVDSDDFIEDTYIESLYRAIKKNNAEIAICGFKLVDDKNNIYGVEKVCESETILNGKDVLKMIQQPDGYKVVVVWNKMYKVEIFDNVRFEKGLKFEDELICLYIFWDCNRVVMIPDELYMYVKRNDSQMARKFSWEDVKTLQNIHLVRINFYNENHSEELLLREQQLYCNWLVNCMFLFKDVIDKNRKKEFQKEMRKYCKILMKNNGIPRKVYIQNLLGYLDLNLAAIVKKNFKKIKNGRNGNV